MYMYVIYSILYIVFLYTQHYVTINGFDIHPKKNLAWSDSVTFQSFRPCTKALVMAGPDTQGVALGIC